MEKQIDDYELRAAPDNLRFTTWYPDFGMFIKKDYVTPEQMEERYKYAIESRGRTKQKKPIAERLKEGAEQAAKDNSARSAPAKNTEKSR